MADRRWSKIHRDVPESQLGHAESSSDRSRSRERRMQQDRERRDIAARMERRRIYDLDGDRKYIERDRREMEAFLTAFGKPTITKSRFLDGVYTVSSTDPVENAVFTNRIDVRSGKIEGWANFKRGIRDWYLTDITYCQLELVLQEAGMNISDFNLSTWHDHAVTHDDTKRVAQDLLEEVGQSTFTFEAGSDRFRRIREKDAAKPKFHLLDDHPNAFIGKHVGSITLTLEGKALHMDYNYWNF